MVYGKAIAMIDLRASVSIYRPIQKVFEFLSTTENDFQWQYGTLESARISSDAVGVGVFFRSIGHVMGRRLLATFEITEYEANKRYGFKSLSGPLSSRTLYTLDAANGCTRVNVSTQVSAVDAVGIHEKIFAKQLKKQLKENLGLLKGILESR